MTIIVLLTQRLQYTLVKMFEKNPRLNQLKQEQTDRCSCLVHPLSSFNVTFWWVSQQPPVLHYPVPNNESSAAQPQMSDTQKSRYRLFFTHTCTHTHTHTHTHTGTHTTHTQAHTHTLISTHTQMCAHTHEHTHSHEHTHTHTHNPHKRGWGLRGWQGCTWVFLNA